MYYVYLIQSTSHPDQRYVGFTQDLKSRLKAHNAGESKHTSKFCPWELVTYHAFKDKHCELVTPLSVRQAIQKIIDTNFVNCPLGVCFKTPSPSSFPEFLLAKILGESMNSTTLWIALEFSLRKIQAMTMQLMRFEAASKTHHFGY